jgi:molybdopterin adenylyltransferase
VAGPVSGGRGRTQGAAPGHATRRRALVVTVSDGVAAGTRQDSSGEGLAVRLAQLGYEVDRAAVADDRPAIAELLAASDGYALVITTGGTGLTPRDVTPQATKEILDYEIPGLAELMRASGARSTPFSYLSRSVAGVRDRRLIVNVPGSPRGALESLAALEPVLEHALETLAGPFDHHAAGAASGRDPVARD